MLHRPIETTPDFGNYDSQLLAAGQCDHRAKVGRHGQSLANAPAVQDHGVGPGLSSTRKKPALAACHSVVHEIQGFAVITSQDGYRDRELTEMAGVLNGSMQHSAQTHIHLKTKAKSAGED